MNIADKIKTAVDKIMAGDASSQTLAELESSLMEGTIQDADTAARRFKVYGGCNAPETPPHRQAALEVACTVEEKLRARRNAALPKIVFVVGGTTPSNRRVMPEVITGGGETIEVSVQWDEKNERLRSYREGGGSIPASNGKGKITTPTGEFSFSVSQSGTSDGYQYLSDEDAWAACPDARASVGHP